MGGRRPSLPVSPHHLLPREKYPSPSLTNCGREGARGISTSSKHPSASAPLFSPLKPLVCVELSPGHIPRVCIGITSQDEYMSPAEHAAAAVGGRYWPPRPSLPHAPHTIERKATSHICQLPCDVCWRVRAPINNVGFSQSCIHNSHILPYKGHVHLLCQSSPKDLFCPLSCPASKVLGCCSSRLPARPLGSGRLPHAHPPHLSGRCGALRPLSMTGSGGHERTLDYGCTLQTLAPHP